MPSQTWSNDIPLHSSPAYAEMPLEPPHASSSRQQSYSSSSTAAPYHNHNDSQYGTEDEDDVFDPFSIDPNLRLRTVRTAHSVIAESIRSEHHAERRKRKRRLFSSMRRRGTLTTVKESFRAKRSPSDGAISAAAISDNETIIPTPRKSSVRKSKAPSEKPSAAAPNPQDGGGKGKGKALPRREIFVNLSLPPNLLNNAGDPIVRYVRNKVRTSKYTIITFLPRNLFEQFRRVANIYFLSLVILQLFPIFGAPNAQIGMLPLLAILGMTAIKDAIEDWRRAKLDNEVNNSAATKLEGWRNVNQPKDPRTFFERLFGLGQAPDKVSKGVRKLRQMDANAGHQIIMERQKEMEDEEELESARIQGSHPLEIVSRPSLSSDASGDDLQSRVLHKIPSAPSMMSRKSSGVLDWAQPGKGTAHWERTLWKKLEVGDFVLLRDNEQVPADIIVLSSSNADGLAFVETKNLDGETNLKVRRALKATATMSSEEDLEHSHFVIDSEPPHANLYTYNGVLKYRSAGEGKGAEEKQEAITINELLLRGCTIRNTKWVIGMVVFTGADTKIMLNGGDTPSKRSKIEKETNFNVIMNFIVLMILCILTAILHGWYRSLSRQSADYYEVGAFASDNIYLDSVIIFASCLIVFQNIVPISLYITIEIVKTVQAYFIFQDVEMYYEPYDTPCVPKTWNISDDLGQIEYVFSDKTGTLTQNIMEFKKCSIQGITFGEGITEAMMGAAKREGRDLSSEMANQDVELAAKKDKMVREMKASFNNRYFQEDKLTLIAPNLPKYLANPSDPLRPYIIDFFRAISICHSVLADIPEPKKPFQVDYKAESPDEAALVAAARDAGFPFVNRNNTRIDVEVLGRAERWIPLRVLEFNSTRKRMSVIVRDPQGRVVLFCKGADSVIYERLAPDHDPELKASTLRDLEEFANGGLRTLCIAQRYLDEEEYTNWAKKYDAASAAVTDREAKIESSCELIEHSLTILGATALEDKLQEGVPESIAMLHQAGIKLWILTGDKLQTAIEIGYSCNLLTNDMEVMIISADSEDGARAQIEAGLNKIASVLGPPIVNRSRKGEVSTDSSTQFAVVIDGDSLRYALQPNLKGLFLSLGTQCSAVICCRVSPSQKALTVKLVKDGCKAMTLSIGDGANDVAMIQEANVGVGLYGLEGSQAAMSADYAFGQFRFLTRLLLVHGRWSYVRIADMHANFFYKNIIWVIAMFWFLIFNNFDATYLFEYTFMLLYNLVFTSLPVGVIGAFDQDTNAKASMAFPQLYKRGIKGLEYTRRRFWIYMTDGLYQSAVLFFIPFLAYGDGTTWSSTGMDTNSLWDFGTSAATAGVMAANAYVGVNTRYWTFITAIVIIGSTLLVFIWIPIYSSLAALPYNGEVSVIYPTFSYWAVVALTVFICVAPRWLASAFRQSYFPRDKDIIREAWVAGTLKEQLGIQHRRDRDKITVNNKTSSSSSPSMPFDEEEEVETGDHPKFVQHLQRALKDADEDIRGKYEPANLYSPQKSPPALSGISGTSTPRSPFSYPPGPPSPLIDANILNYSPSPRYTPTIPPPLFVRTGSDEIPPPKSHSPGHSGLSTPVQPRSATTTAQDAVQLASSEIKRLNRTSTDLKRASLSVNTSPDGTDFGRTDTGVIISPTRIGGSLGRRGSRSSSKIISPVKRHSLGPAAAAGGLFGVAETPRGLNINANGDGLRDTEELSPITRGNRDRGSGYVDESSLRGGGSVDFSESSHWEEEAGRRTSGYGESHGSHQQQPAYGYSSAPGGYAV